MNYIIQVVVMTGKGAGKQIHTTKAKKKNNEKITLQPRHNFTHQVLQPLVRTQLIALGIFTSLRSDLGYKCQSRGGLKRFSLLSSYFPKGVLTDH